MTLFPSGKIQSRKCFLWAGVICLLLSGNQSAWADAKNYQSLLGSTTWVLAKSGGKNTSGTGVLVDGPRKLVVTNFHVVGEARVAIIFFPALKDDKVVVERKHYVDNVKTLGIRGRV